MKKIEIIEINNAFSHMDFEIPVHDWGEEVRCPICKHVVSPDPFCFDDLSPCEHVEFIFGGSNCSHYAREDLGNIDEGISQLSQLRFNQVGCSMFDYETLLINFLGVDSDRKFIKMDDGIYNAMYFSFKKLEL